MATYRLLTTRATATTLFSNRFLPVRSVSAAISTRRSFNTHCDHANVYDSDFLSDLFDRVKPVRSMSQIYNMAESGGGELGERKGWGAKENGEYLSLRFDMPGLDKDNVKILVEQDTLIIKAESENESEDEEEEELPHAYFGRLNLPVDLYKLKEIQAEMKNGVLKVLVPKVKPEERNDVWEVEVK
ncbi:putative alpha crystallin/Hsp20 domain, HSP20-like chaperone [Helianthus annuus]|uniref:Putative HSP20-like chaperone n=1 Tax=Helianthus annuus TaxID=4232 RepID=A0A251SWA1_HELAN|nr:23.6 kDa heat shock protein, mitochondrial [Helianthus annuus]KAF5774922.1 putative small heat shock protein HSP20 [Helianthus annuus]KAJ0478160.1 putative Heat shock protein HSP14.7/HSP23.5/HSP23.6 [Helianthus annuus]KAJ0482858.1 putative alpha crystallin/Hsp20 domain, HSP20-like chaperone [Helianthus annuus]KAJ0499047.1 putative Heat shock protein HSP14.7/HSP23.5/HSP23.6 [Helianthus annuus]KAJ0665061.1 putative Heat shock protein HSP14.7/HSP23.5/HSP23.6 [Helianthus annuus]